MADPAYIEPVELTIEQVKERSLELSRRPFLSVIDQAELNIIVQVLTGERDAFWITNIWRTILPFHNHDPGSVAFIDEDDWRHEPYATYREQARTVYERLRALAEGLEVEEDVYTHYPQDEDESDANERYLRSILARAAEYLSRVYNASAGFDGNDLLQLVEFNVLYAIRQHFAEEWFDDPYAVGYAMMKYPIEGSSAFGETPSQTALTKAFADIVAEAAQAVNNDDNTRDLQPYEHRLQLFWPVLKSIAYFAAHEMNSPASRFDDELLDTIEHALNSGRLAYADLTHRLSVPTHGWSKMAVEIGSTPSHELIQQLRDRVTREREQIAQFARMR